MRESIIVEGIPLKNIAKKYGFSYANLYRKYKNDPNITIEQIILARESDLAREFKKKYKMSFEEYAEFNGLSASTVRKRFLHGNDPLERRKPMVLAGKTVREWQDLSGMGYARVRAIYDKLGEDMKLEDLKPSTYQSAGFSKRKPVLVKKSNKAKQNLVLLALKRERERAFG